MSVLIPDRRIFGAIANQMAYAARTRQDGIHHIQCCQMLTNHQISQYVNHWFVLNQLSYVLRYHEPLETIDTPPTLYYESLPVDAYQFLKWLECLRYNIEMDTLEEKNYSPSAPQREAIAFLETLIVGVMDAIIGTIDRYKKANWSQFLPEGVQP